jgi:hypothetical protein
MDTAKKPQTEKEPISTYDGEDEPMQNSISDELLDNLEDDPQDPDQEPEQKFYSADQVAILLCSETINHILIEQPMSPLKAQRLTEARNFMLYQNNLVEFIPEVQKRMMDERIQAEQEQQRAMEEEIAVQYRDQPQQPLQPQPVAPAPEPAKPEQKVPMMKEGLDAITAKLGHIDDGVMETVKPPEPTGIDKLLGRFSKPKPDEKVLKTEHQPESMG